MFCARAPLLERERELAALTDLIRDAAAGEGRIVLIEGPAGVGKTRLLGETRERAAAAGFRDLYGRGSELEREFPFGVVRQLFEASVIADADRLLAGAAAPARSVFEGFGDGGEPTDDPSFAALHSLYWLTVNHAAGGPLLLAVDDLHWSDRPSVRFLAYLVRRLEGLPVLVACCVRTSEPMDAALLAELAADPMALALKPRPLSAAAVSDLVARHLRAEADEAFTAQCQKVTGGNPLLLNRLLHALGAEGARPDAAHVGMVAEVGPRAVSQAVLPALARLPDHAVALARAAAVLGGGAELAMAAALAGIDEQEARSAAAALVRTEILQPRPDLAFLQPLVGAAVYHELPAQERDRQHARAAHLLAASGAAVDRIAAHLLASPRNGEDWVVEILRKAATAALQRGAPESAVAYLGRALAEPPSPAQRADVLLELGRAEAHTNGPAAVDHLREGFEELTDPVARATAAQTLARALLFTGQAADGAALARRAAADLPAERHDLREALEAFELVCVYFGAGDPGALSRLRRERVRSDRTGIGAKMLAAVAASEWAYSGGPSDRCVGLALDALDGGELIAADNGLLGIVAITILVLADHPAALDAWDASLADAHRRGSLLSKCAVSLWHGFMLYRRGELADAEVSLRTAYQEGEAWGLREGLAHCAAFLADVSRERGDLAESHRRLERATDPGDASESARYWLSSQLELLLAERRFEEAIGVADDLARRFSFIEHPIDTPWRSPKALALLALDRREEGLALAAAELELARRWAGPGALARALRVLGTLEGDRGLDRLRQAVEVVAGSPARLEHAKALAALGGALRRARQVREAREALRRALELAAACQAAGLVAQVRSELHAVGARPRTTALSGVEALTASERRVAALAARGATNREVAQLLFVTPKTVEVHLRNAYRKLGIRSRRELSHRLGIT